MKGLQVSFRSYIRVVLDLGSGTAPAKTMMVKDHLRHVVDRTLRSDADILPECLGHQSAASCKFGLGTPAHKPRVVNQNSSHAPGIEE